MRLLCEENGKYLLGVLNINFPAEMPCDRRMFLILWKKKKKEICAWSIGIDSTHFLVKSLFESSQAIDESNFALPSNTSSIKAPWQPVIQPKTSKRSILLFKMFLCPYFEWHFHLLALAFNKTNDFGLQIALLYRYFLFLKYMRKKRYFNVF